MDKPEKSKLVMLIISAIAVIPTFFGIPQTAKSFFLLYAYILSGYEVLFTAVKKIIHKDFFNESVLMSTATLGALLLGDFSEAAAVMIFYKLGELLEDIAHKDSRKKIKKLLDLTPDYARIVSENGEIVKALAADVTRGTVFVVKPGEKIPADGLILSGESELDISFLTGESIPKTVKAGDEVLSGSINMLGVLKISATMNAGESAAANILQMVEKASENKARSVRFITRFAKIYTPAVFALALIIAVLPPLVLRVIGAGVSFTVWFRRALTVLVISCPCALVIGVPLSFFCSAGAAASRGILIKNGESLEYGPKLKSIFFDKTGTLTSGEFSVESVNGFGMTEEEVIRTAAAAESFSAHPLAKSILKFYGKAPDENALCDFREYPGGGVSVTQNGDKLLLGRADFLEKNGVIIQNTDSDGTAVYLAKNGNLCGKITFTDSVKPSAKDGISKLISLGVNKLCILTGDNASSAMRIGELVGIKEIFSGLLPQDKLSLVAERIQKSGKKEKTAFVGDGINDAPALARADIGIAAGNAGLAAACENADVVISDGDIGKIPEFVKISEKCMRIVSENIVFSLAVKIVCLLLAAIGLADMRLSAFADTGVMLLAVLNSLRAIRIKKEK